MKYKKQYLQLRIRETKKNGVKYWDLEGTKLFLGFIPYWVYIDRSYNYAAIINSMNAIKRTDGIDAPYSKIIQQIIL